MFPSTSHNASSDPNNVVSLPFLSDIINASKQDQDLILPLSLLNSFPSSPFSSLYSEEAGAAVLLQPVTTDFSLPQVMIDAMEPGGQFLGTSISMNNNKATKQLPVQRKRSSKKDRHSKIYTAQGPRDRRMRLSLEVAREFFDLQDMLGFDKASKTVAWLFTQSKSAIEELCKDFSDTNCKLAGGERVWASSPSECDVVSGVFDESVDAFNDGDQPEKPEGDSKGCQPEPLPGKARKTRRSQTSTRRVSSAHLARESRDKARVRAKERTREKMLIRNLNICNGSKPFEVGEESATSQLGHNHMKLPLMEVQAEVEDPKQLGAITEQIIEDPFTTTNNCLQSDEILQENQFRDCFQSFLKTWEAYNGTYLC